MSLPPGPITGPSAWRGEDLRRTDGWVHTFTPSELSELHRALARVHARALTLPEIGRDDFRPVLLELLRLVGVDFARERAQAEFARLIAENCARQGTALGAGRSHHGQGRPDLLGRAGDHRPVPP